MLKPGKFPHCQSYQTRGAKYCAEERDERRGNFFGCEAHAVKGMRADG